MSSGQTVHCSGIVSRSRSGMLFLFLRQGVVYVTYVMYTSVLTRNPGCPQVGASVFKC